MNAKFKVIFFQFLQDTSFQVVLISGSNYSFILMNYGDIAVTGHPVEVKETCFLYCEQNITVPYCIKVYPLYKYCLYE